MENLEELVGLQPTDRVLDIGCGSGEWALALARRCAYVTGICLTEDEVAEASARAISAGASNVSFQWPGSSGVSQRIASPDHAFDWVTSRWVLSRTLDTALALSEMMRVLRAPGRLLLTEIAANEDSDKRAAHLRMMQARDSSDVNAYSPKQIRGMLRGKGLTIEHEGDWAVPRRLSEWMDEVGAAESTTSRIRRLLSEAARKKSTDWQIVVHGKSIEFSQRNCVWVALKLE